VINKDSKIHLEISGAQAAKLYAILGVVNGPYCDLFETLQGVLDKDRIKYDSLVYEKTYKQTIDYNSYYAEWESMLFQKPEKTPQEKELDKLNQQLVELQAQIEVVKQTVKS